MKARTILGKFAAIGLTAVLLAGCGGNGENGNSESAPAENASESSSEDFEQTYEVSLHTPDNVDGIWGKWTGWFADQVKEKSNGQITINVFYNNALGESKEMFTQLSNGEIEMIEEGTLPVDYYAPEYGFLVAPYLLKGPDHLRALIDSELFEGFASKLEENNIRMSAVAVRNPRNTMSSKTVEWSGLNNANNLVIRMPDNTLFVDAWQKIGASCQIIGGGEIYSSMQTGVINSCEGPYDQFTELKLQELGGRLYNTEHVTEFRSIYICKSWYDGLSDELKMIIDETAEEAMQSASKEAFEKSEENRQLLLDAGFEQVEIDVNPLFDAVAPVWEEKFETDWTASTYEEVMGYAP